MKLIIEATSKEMADLVKELQDQPDKNIKYVALESNPKINLMPLAQKPICDKLAKEIERLLRLM